MSARCPFCFTMFTDEDYQEHIKAHADRSFGAKQKAYEMKRAAEYQESKTRHKPGEACDCSFHGVKDYCEALRPEHR